VSLRPGSTPKKWARDDPQGAVEVTVIAFIGNGGLCLSQAHNLEVQHDEHVERN